MKVLRKPGFRRFGIQAPSVLTASEYGQEGPTPFANAWIGHSGYQKAAPVQEADCLSGPDNTCNSHLSTDINTVASSSTADRQRQLRTGGSSADIFFGQNEVG